MHECIYSFHPIPSHSIPYFSFHVISFNSPVIVTMTILLYIHFHHPRVCFSQHAVDYSPPQLAHPGFMISQYGLPWFTKFPLKLVDGDKVCSGMCPLDHPSVFLNAVPHVSLGLGVPICGLLLLPLCELRENDVIRQRISLQPIPGIKDFKCLTECQGTIIRSTHHCHSYWSSQMSKMFMLLRMMGDEWCWWMMMLMDDDVQRWWCWWMVVLIDQSATDNVVVSVTPLLRYQSDWYDQMFKMLELGMRI